MSQQETDKVYLIRPEKEEEEGEEETGSQTTTRQIRIVGDNNNNNGNKSKSKRRGKQSSSTTKQEKREERQEEEEAKEEEQQEEKRWNGWMIACIVLTILIILLLVGLIVWAATTSSNCPSCDDCICDAGTGPDGDGPSCADMLLQRENEVSELNKRLSNYQKQTGQFNRCITEISCFKSKIESRAKHEREKSLRATNPVIRNADGDDNVNDNNSNTGGGSGGITDQFFWTDTLRQLQGILALSQSVSEMSVAFQ